MGQWKSLGGYGNYAVKSTNYNRLLSAYYDGSFL